MPGFFLEIKLPKILAMADFLWLERFDTITNVDNMNISAVIECAPVAYRYEKKKNTIKKG